MHKYIICTYIINSNVAQGYFSKNHEVDHVKYSGHEMFAIYGTGYEIELLTFG